MTSPKIFLADLRYDYSGFLANDCMPLGVAYMKAAMDRDLPEVSSRLFAYPDKLVNAIRDERPDVVMVSNYVWNESLSCHIAKFAKKVNPDCLTVMGGPNISNEPERQIEFLALRPELDLYALGEGDFLATEIVKQFLDAGKSIQKLGEREVPSSVYRRPDGTVYRNTTWDRHKEIDEIPSPWLTGIQDEFFDGRLAPLMETNRGCPFTCTFCVQGTRWYTKVHNFDVERVKEEIEYVARRIHELSPSQGTLRIADSNYGMYTRDIEISGFIGGMMKKYGYPKYIDATTGKNRPERIIESVEKASGALVVYQAVQSLDENVLRNVKRQNIKLDAYRQLQAHMRGRGLRSNSDLILGLPGETLQSHLKARKELLDSGINQVTNFQLMMLKGSELEELATREMFQFKTRFRVLPKNFGVYGDEKVFDIEEIVVETDTLSFDDYVTAREHALCSVAFWHDDMFEEAVQFLSQFGITRSQCWDAVLPALDQAEGPAKQFVQDFVRETIGELFETREACYEFYNKEENFQRLLRGEIGDNLMHKYHALATFYIWPEICEVAMRAFRNLLEEAGADRQIPDFETFWADFTEFLTQRQAHGRTVKDILSSATASFRYDISAWLDDEHPSDIAKYRLFEPEEFHFELAGSSRDCLSAALAVWTANIKGLTKMVTRIKVEWLIRDVRRVGESAVETMVA